MSRLGYKCDKCGTEIRGRDPAAYVGRNGEQQELCSPCYEEFHDEREAGA